MPTDRTLHNLLNIQILEKLQPVPTFGPYSFVDAGPEMYGMSASAYNHLHLRQLSSPISTEVNRTFSMLSPVCECMLGHPDFANSLKTFKPTKELEKSVNRHTQEIIHVNITVFRQKP